MHSTTIAVAASALAHCLLAYLPQHLACSAGGAAAAGPLLLHRERGVPAAGVLLQARWGLLFPCRGGSNCGSPGMQNNPQVLHCQPPLRLIGRRKPVWAALARAATEELRDRQFAALSDQQALSILQVKCGVGCRVCAAWLLWQLALRDQWAQSILHVSIGQPCGMHVAWLRSRSKSWGRHSEWMGRCPVCVYFPDGLHALLPPMQGRKLGVARLRLLPKRNGEGAAYSLSDATQAILPWRTAGNRCGKWPRQTPPYLPAACVQACASLSTWAAPPPSAFPAPRCVQVGLHRTRPVQRLWQQCCTACSAMHRRRSVSSMISSNATKQAPAQLCTRHWSTEHPACSLHAIYRRPRRQAAAALSRCQAGFPASQQPAAGGIPGGRGGLPAQYICAKCICVKCIRSKHTRLPCSQVPSRRPMLPTCILRG